MQEELLEHLRAATSGEFEILGEIGHGGMARVYLAQELALDRRVAVKVLSPLFAEYPEIVKRFQHEARTAGQLNHPHIVPVFAVYQGDGLSFFTMPFVKGASFREIIREGPLETEEALEFLRQAASGLAYAHQHGVIHRDVKPENMMLEETTGRLVLTDFGLAKALGAESLTVPGDMIGTPHYMAPEQLEDNVPVDGRCDEYSLAMVAYEMLAGEHPFGGGGFRELLMKQLNENPSPIRERRPDLPQHVCDAIHLALSKSPDDRFDTVEEFTRAMLGGKLVERKKSVRRARGPKRGIADTKTVWMRDRLLRLHRRRRLMKWTGRVALSAAATLAIYLGVAAVSGSGPPLGRAANDQPQPTEGAGLGAAQLAFEDIDLSAAGDAADLHGPPAPPASSEVDRSGESPAQAGVDQARLPGAGPARTTTGRGAEPATREDRSTTEPAAARNEERPAAQQPAAAEPEVEPVMTNDEPTQTSNAESPDSTAAGAADPDSVQPGASEPVVPPPEVERVTADMVVEQYRRALETEDVEGLSRLYGGEVPPEDLTMLTRIFESADDLQVNLGNRDTRLQGDFRLEDVDFEMRYVLARTGRNRDFTLKLRLTLEEGPAGWQLVRLDRRDRR
ncbi:MAG: protein kinase [Gemmatimonadales bacterium]|jgi:serine/threonine-protein kinase